MSNINNEAKMDRGQVEHQELIIFDQQTSLSVDGHILILLLLVLQMLYSMSEPLPNIQQTFQFRLVERE